MVKDQDGSVIFYLFLLVRLWLGFCSMAWWGSLRAVSVAGGATWRLATDGLRREFGR